MPRSDGEEARGDSRTRWKIALKLAVSAALVTTIARRIDVPATFKVFSAADVGLLACAALLVLAGQALSGLKWRLLAVAVGFEGGWLRFIGDYYVGVFFNTFGLGTVGGDVVRALALAGRGGRRSLAVQSVLADRLSGLVTLLGIAFVSLLLFRRYPLPSALYWTTLFFCAALVGGWRLAPRVLPRVLAPGNRLRLLVERDLARYWDDGGLLARVGALSLVFHLSQIVALWVLARALGLAVPLSYCFIAGPLVNFLAAMPVSLNGLGVREGGYVYFLSLIGLSSESAVAFALGWFVLVLLSGGVGGIVYLARRSR